MVEGNFKIYCFDLDLTLCHTEGTNYAASVPYQERINRVNELFSSGSVIKILTARGSRTGLDLRELTEKQLRDWGVHYHELHFGKPDADVYIDDKGVNSETFPWHTKKI